MNTEALRQLGVSEALIAHLENHSPSSPLGFRCQPPVYWRSSPIAERGIIPLWECGMVLWFFNPKTRMFEERSLECIDDIWSRHRSLQSVLAHLFLDLYEDETDNDTLRALAADAQFTHIERLLSEVERAIDDEAYSNWRDGFPDTCN